MYIFWEGNAIAIAIAIAIASSVNIVEGPSNSILN